jgi:hypothetical protein
LLEDAPPEAIRFIAGLAKVSEERRYDDVPRDLARAAKARVEKMVERGQPATALLAPLQRCVLRLEPAGRDIVPVVVDQLGRCFRGELSFSYAQHLLEGRLASRWDRHEEQRLRVLACQAAFEAGFEVRNILEACQVAPALERVFQTGDLRYLAALRLLHAMARHAPWEKLGGARTVYELAADSGEVGPLLELPDLVLLHEDRSVSLLDRVTRRPRATRIALCSDGVRIGNAMGDTVGDVMLTAVPQVIEVRGPTAMGVHELRLDGTVLELTSDPTLLMARVERWSRFFVQEFRPQSSEVLRWQSTSGVTAFQPQHLVECPDCHRTVFPRAGDVAVPLEVGRLLSV